MAGLGKMYKLMYDPTSFTPFFWPAISTICSGQEIYLPLYIVLLARFVDWMSGDYRTLIHPFFNHSEFPCPISPVPLLSLSCPCPVHVPSRSRRPQGNLTRAFYFLCGLFLHFLKDRLAVGFQDSQEFILRHFLMLIRLPAEKIVGINTVVFRQPLHRCNRGVACSALVFAVYVFGHVYNLSHLALSHLFLCSEFNQSASCYGRRLLFYAP